MVRELRPRDRVAVQLQRRHRTLGRSRMNTRTMRFDHDAHIESHPHPRDQRILYHRGRYVIDGEYCWDQEEDGASSSSSSDSDATPTSSSSSHESPPQRCPLPYQTIEAHVNQYFEDRFDEHDWAERLGQRTTGPYAAHNAAAILKKWKDGHQDHRSRRQLTTALHLAIRAHFEARDIPLRIVPPEFMYFSQFQQHAQHHHWTPYRHDWAVFDDRCGLVGRLDAAYQMANKRLVLVLWKRQRQVRGTSTVMAKTPFQRVADCDLMRFGMQLNLYKHILHTFYGQTVQRMYVVAMYHPFHVDIDKNVHLVKSIAPRSMKMLRARRQATRAVAANPYTTTISHEHDETTNREATEDGALVVDEEYANDGHDDDEGGEGTPTPNDRRVARCSLMRVMEKQSQAPPHCSLQVQYRPPRRIRKGKPGQSPQAPPPPPPRCSLQLATHTRRNKTRR